MNLTHWLKRPDRRDPATPQGKPRLRLEALETREVPAIFLDPGTGTLTLTGTTGADNVLIDSFGSNTLVRVNNESATFAPGQVNRVDVRAGAGADEIAVVTSRFPVNVDTGEGGDRVFVTLSNVRGLVTVEGGDGAFTGSPNFLQIDDRENGIDSTFSLSAGQLIRDIPATQATASVEYTDMNTIAVLGGNGANTYNVESLAAGSNVNLFAGAASDTFNFSPTGRDLDNFIGGNGVSISGGGGADAAIVRDEANAKKTSYTFTAAGFETHFSRGTFTASSADIFYNGDLEQFIVQGGSADNGWGVHDVRTSTFLTGGAGADEFRVNGGANNLSAIGGLFLDGGAGADFVDVVDTANAAATTYTVTNLRVQRQINGQQSSTRIVYQDVEGMDISGGSAGNTYDVQGLAADTLLDLFAGGGGDTFRVGVNNLNSVGGTLGLFGGGGFDSVDVFDSANVAPTTYSLSTSILTRRINGQQATAQVSYSGVEDLDVFGGSAGNTYDIESSSAGTNTSVTGGAGNDLFRFGTDLDFVDGFVSVSGGGGFDTIELNDTAQTAATAYQVTDSNFKRFVPGVAGVAEVGFAGLEAVAVLGGSGANTFEVFNTAVNTSTDVVGGAGNDTFRIAPGGNLNAIGGQVTVRGGGGTDSILVNDSANTVQAAYNLGADSLSRVVGSTSARINVDGLEGMTVLGGSAGNTYNVLNTDVNMPVEFRAGGGADTFHISPTSQTLRTTPGGVSFVGGGGFDTVVIHDELNPQAATYLLSADRLFRRVAGQQDTTIRFSGHEKLIVNAGSGDDSLTAADAAALAVPVTFDAGAGNDVLKGAPNAENTFEVTGPNAGRLTIAGGASALQFSNTENLVGGDRADRFRFGSAGEVAGVTDGGFGNDALDYSALTTGVVVNLSAGIATRTRNVGSIENVFGGSGDDNVRGSELDNILMGNGGNDVLTGGAGNDIVVGGNGDDTISGGAGRNVLIGGLGGDTITGGADEDLLIAGPTAFDDGVSALRSIMAEWASAAPIGTRIGHLQGTLPGGLNDVVLIAGFDVQRLPGGIIPDPRTVFDDGVPDVVTGGAGADWFFFSPNDSTDLGAGDIGTDTGDGTI